jgi:galactokinase
VPDLRKKVLSSFHQRFGEKTEFITCAPGRVNLLGEHVDYNEGLVMPVAIDLETVVAFRKSATLISTLTALNLDEEISFSPQSIQKRQDIHGNRLPIWAQYPAGVMWALNGENQETPGIDAVFASNLPMGAGLSSSASIEMAFVEAWNVITGWYPSPIQLAFIGHKAEVEYVGINCGIMDQFTSVFGEKDQILLLDCRSLEWRSFPLPKEIAIVIADSGVRRSLKTSEYNNRQKECNLALQILKKKIPGIHSLRDVTLPQFDQFGQTIPDLLSKRVHHVIGEIARVDKAVKFLEKNDYFHFGKLMNECHNSLRDFYEVSCPELDTLVSLAQEIPGCYGARLTGAGFGGCTVNLVMKKSVDNFKNSLSAGYAHITGIVPQIYICSASDGAHFVRSVAGS